MSLVNTTIVHCCKIIWSPILIRTASTYRLTVNLVDLQKQDFQYVNFDCETSVKA